MGDHDVGGSTDDESIRRFTKAVLEDVQALEEMLRQGVFENGAHRIGAEQELFLVDRAMAPAPVAPAVLERANDPRLTTEIALFNLEANLTPRIFTGRCLSDMHREMDEILERIRGASAASGAEPILCGTLPTLRKEHLTIDNLTPSPRYESLNRTLKAQRGGAFQIQISGIDALEDTHDNLMLESCNTSFQLHYQVAPHEFARLYNRAQIVTAPVLAAAVNTPLLFGRRLWGETRIALFQQSTDPRSSALQARGQMPRVGFGDRWVESSVTEIFREDIARFRAVLAAPSRESPAHILARGEIPSLSALRLHNGSIWRWNRPCYGVTDGKPHLRIENRVLPSGPTVVDEMANAAFYFGLLVVSDDELDAIPRRLPFTSATENFYAAARQGLGAQLTWLKGNHAVSELILNELLPLAREGLRQHGIDDSDAAAYLDVVQARVKSGQTGARWALSSLAAMGETDRWKLDTKLRAVTSATLAHQKLGEPVHDWPLRRAPSQDDWIGSIRVVGQIMSTDLFTVRPHDLVDLAAAVMEWKHVRHVPVEDDQGKLVGLISHRALLRMLAQARAAEVSVADIMERDPLTVTSGTSTLDAIDLMRSEGTSCLPVVDAQKLVGILTEADLTALTRELLREALEQHD